MKPVTKIAKTYGLSNLGIGNPSLRARSVDQLLNKFKLFQNIKTQELASLQTNFEFRI